MTKILYIHHGGTLGGAPRSLAFLIDNLDRDKYIPYVLMIEDGPARSLFESAGAIVIIDSRLGAFHGTKVSGMSIKLFLRNLLYIFPTLFYGEKSINKLDPDIIHLNTTCLFLYAKIAKKINNSTKVITHVREPLLDSFFGWILKTMNYKYVDAYIAIEQYDMNQMKIGNKLNEVIYNAVDLLRYNPSNKSSKLREELNFDENDIVFLSLSRFTETNGILEFIRTLKSIKLEDNLKFVFVGKEDNHLNKYQKRVLELAEEINNVYILPFRDDVIDLIASSDVNLCTFTKPHFSRAVIESAAMEKPFLVTNVRGLDELVVQNETGLVFQMDDTENLKDCIYRLSHNHNLRKKMGKNARDRAVQLFDIKKNTIKVMSIYDKLINN